MQIERETLNMLVPEGFPPERLIQPGIRRRAESLEDPLLRRSYLWATAVIVAGFQSDLPLPPRFAHLSAGLVSLSSENYRHEMFSLPLSSEYAFGAYVLALSEKESQTIQSIAVGDVTMPLVVTYGNQELHGCPPHPRGGAASCWVENGSVTGTWQKGILTCRHIVKTLQKGQPVTLSPSQAHQNPSTASLAEIDECTIDASVLSIQSSEWPQGLNRLSICAPAAPGQQVVFEDRTAHRQMGSVLRVFHYGTYAGRLFGQRVIADCYGSRGDSGSLLLDGTSGDGIGIYMGTIPDGTGGKQGIFQDLDQVRAYFGLNFYR